MSKIVLVELLWVAGSLIAAITICCFLFTIDVSKGTFDLQVYDTYLVFSAVTILVPAFLLLTFVSYFVKELRKRFSRPLPNTILLTAGILLIASISFINKELLTQAVSAGFIIYPPLAAVPNVQPRGDTLNNVVVIMTTLLTVSQLLVTVALLYTTFRWGRQPNR